MGQYESKDTTPRSLYVGDLPRRSDVMKSKISPDVQRPGSSVVGLVLTNWVK